MKNKTVADPKILTELACLFAAYRKKMTGDLPRYPSDFKEHAVSALKAGHKRVAVAEASGVGLGTLTEWRRQKSKKLVSPKMPRELEVVDKPKAWSEPSSGVQIYFPSGVRMELAFAAVTPAFMATLRSL